MLSKHLGKQWSGVGRWLCHSDSSILGHDFTVSAQSLELFFTWCQRYLMTEAKRGKQHETTGSQLSRGSQGQEFPGGSVRLKTCMAVSINGGTPKSFALYNGIFHHNPSILGYPHLWKPPYIIVHPHKKFQEQVDSQCSTVPCTSSWWCRCYEGSWR